MISEREKMEIIRQAEKNNLTNQQMERLHDWAIQVRVEQSLLDLLLLGHIELADMDDDNEPRWCITKKGCQYIESLDGYTPTPFVFQEVFDGDEDCDEEEYDDYDDEEEYEDEDDEDGEDFESDIDISHIENPEEATFILQSLLNKLHAQEKQKLEERNNEKESEL